MRSRPRRPLMFHVFIWNPRWWPLQGIMNMEPNEKMLKKSFSQTQTLHKWSFTNFIPFLQTRMIIHWSSYCTVYVYVVIHFCGNVWSSWVEANLCRFFLLFVYNCIVVQLSRDSINNLFNSVTLYCLSTCSSFCWYWWNCWLSLLKLSFHKILGYWIYNYLCNQCL